MGFEVSGIRESYMYISSSRVGVTYEEYGDYLGSCSAGAIARTITMLLWDRIPHNLAKQLALDSRLRPGNNHQIPIPNPNQDLAGINECETGDPADPAVVLCDGHRVTPPNCQQILLLLMMSITIYFCNLKSNPRHRLEIPQE
jgi:hypothetical protein